MLAAGITPVTRAQKALASPAPAVPRRQLAAQRTPTPIKLDGVLDDAAWASAPVASQFTENKPHPGRPERLPTEVRVLYDDAALYVGAMMHDASPDSILRELTQRDNIGNTDFFAVFLDTYRDHLNGYGFIVTTHRRADGRALLARQRRRLRPGTRCGTAA
ncbi:MAG: carbohydrate binding family 9 domain-containing protein [Hymenobacter sp.]